MREDIRNALIFAVAVTVLAALVAGIAGVTETTEGGPFGGVVTGFVADMVTGIVADAGFALLLIPVAGFVLGWVADRVKLMRYSARVLSWLWSGIEIVAVAVFAVLIALG